MTNKIYLESLGCSKNLVDSEVMLGLLAEGGCEIVDLPEKAEIIIINTCSFVEDAIKEAILDGEIVNDYDEAYAFMLKKAAQLNLKKKE